MDYNSYFTAALARLRDERRYRVFADLDASLDASRTPYGIRHTARATS